MTEKHTKRSESNEERKHLQVSNALRGDLLDGQLSGSGRQSEHTVRLFKDSPIRVHKPNEQAELEPVSTEI
jgi:hypothetical protein